MRRRNQTWLRPWEATAPPGGRLAPPTYQAMAAEWRRQARAGRSLPFALTYEGDFVGQVTVTGVTWGSARWAQIGYWVDQRVAGRGVVPTAVALVVDHLFGPVGLHRVEIAIRPENTASLRVVEKLGLRCEGEAPRYLHIDGAWRDHLLFAVTVEEVPDGLLVRYLRRHPEPR